jgi:hypothetical protein
MNYKMLPLLLGTLTREVKCSLQKVTKEWYYDRSIWRVVDLFISNQVLLPYCQRGVINTRCKRIAVMPDQKVVYCEHGIESMYVCILSEKYNRSLQSSSYSFTNVKEYKNASDMKDIPVLRMVPLDVDKIILSVVEDEVYLLTLHAASIGNDSECGTFTIREIPELKGAESIVVTPSRIVCLKNGRLCLCNKDFTGVVTIKFLEYVSSGNSYIDVWDNLIYVAFNRGTINTYTLSGQMVNSFPMESLAVCNMKIHNGVIHLRSEGIFRAYTLEGVILDNRTAISKVTDMDITSKGLFLTTDRSVVYVY